MSNYLHHNFIFNYFECGTIIDSVIKVGVFKLSTESVEMLNTESLSCNLPYLTKN